MGAAREVRGADTTGCEAGAAAATTAVRTTAERVAAPPPFARTWALAVAVLDVAAIPGRAVASGRTAPAFAAHVYPAVAADAQRGGFEDDGATRASSVVVTAPAIGVEECE